MEFAAVPSTAEPVDETSLRRILGLYTTGVTAVTSVGPDEQWVGKTVNSFTAVSLTPPLVLFCLHYEAPMLLVLRRRRAFAVNILAEDHATLSRAFARSGGPRFEEGHWSTGSTGSPILSEALAFLECRVECEYDGGDHAIILGRVARTGRLYGDRPLAFFDSTHTTVEK
ncbi:flavin reductase family protein [Actinopolyspora halophila]|uniref:flavin reductase family protein n=1 Tax=Actinopolyspora halophila TaxID=1850 RepID=UPI00035E3200|nr:flavin reductase family protein [Actinopolyspora halophila]